jgi:hypothetical protein
MGSIVSKPQCDTFDIAVNCNFTKDANDHFLTIGGLQPGQFQGDADIAGIGVSVAPLRIGHVTLLLAEFFVWHLPSIPIADHFRL